jgi:hypothetical protein
VDAGPEVGIPKGAMRVLIACEFSGVVRDAFARCGHDAWSCDLIPSETPGKHIVGDALELLSQHWDLLIAHPPCTYLCGMGIWWNHKRPERWPLTYAARDFVARFWDNNIERVAIENPIGFLSNNWRKPNQVINPWQFGHEANKPTCLWLRGLPPLVPTEIVGKGEFYTKSNGVRMSKWSHITSGTRKEERAKIASRTFPGIAAAMAEQWGNIST